MVRNMFFKAVLLGIVLIATTLEAQPKPAPPLNSYIVQVVEGADPGQVGRGVAQRTRGKLGHVYTNAVKGFSMQLPANVAKQAIESQSGVLVVESDVPVYAVAQTLPKGVDRIEADNSGVTPPVDVDIAMIDTGIDIDHPDLNVVGGRHFYSLWGWLSFEDDLYDDDNGHGSHCAGIAAAKDNDIGVVGVAPGARLWAVKVLDSSGSGYLSDVIAGIDWVTAHASEIEVANMSLAATASSSIFRTAIQNSVSSGIVYTVAAGNDTKDVYGADGVFGTSDDVIPAAYPEAATISAMVDTDGRPGGDGDPTGYGNDDSFANFSNYSHSVVAGNPVTSPGKAIDLLMPGVNIYSCYMNGGYGIGSGTSMASPHAAGLAALYIASNGRANNASGVYAIRQALIDAGVAQTDPVNGLTEQNDPDGNYENIGWAGSEGPPSPVDDPPSVSITYPADGATVSDQVIITANASDDDGVAQVEFFVDEISIGVDTDDSDGWSASWDTTEYSDDAHLIRATATDTALQTSDNSIMVTVNNVTDNPPSVTITNLTDGATVSGQVNVAADATDDVGVTQVEFFVDGGSIGVDTIAPYELSWNSTTVADGSHTITATATDTIGQTSDDSIMVIVDNVPDYPPSVTITSPDDGATVSGQVGVAAGASDDNGVTQVEFFIDGGSLDTDTDGNDGWSTNWDTTLYANGEYTVRATATDTAGQTASNSVVVTVDNPQTTRVASVDVIATPLFSFRNWWVATAMVTVAEDGVPVEGATIDGIWSGLYNKKASNTTDIFGFISFETGWLREPGTVTFTVTRVVAPDGQEYVLDPPEPQGSTTGP